MIIALLSHGKIKAFLTCQADGQLTNGEIIMVDDIVKVFKGDALKELIDIPQQYFVIYKKN